MKNKYYNFDKVFFLAIKAIRRNKIPLKKLNKKYKDIIEKKYSICCETQYYKNKSFDKKLKYEK